MTQYAVLIYGDESAFTDMSPEAWAAMMDAHNAFGAAVAEQGGTIVGGEALAPSATATSVRVGGAVTDGPFVETKELVAGYTIINVKSRQEAIEWTKRFPNPAVDGKEGEIDVRQFFELEDFGPSEAVDRFRTMGMGT